MEYLKIKETKRKTKGISKINSIDFKFLVFICRASRICSRINYVYYYSGIFN